MKYAKSIIIKMPTSHKIPVVQLESNILEVNDALENYLRPRFENDFGVNLKVLDIEAIEINKDTPAYKELKKVTADITSSTVLAQSDVNIQNLKDTQRISAENMEESLRIQREEMQRAQRLQTESTYFGSHSFDRQADVMQTAAESLGKLGGSSVDGSSGGFNPAGMMTGMMMGTTIGGQMTGMINQMGQNVGIQSGTGGNVPPPNVKQQMPFFVYLDNQQKGPFNEPQLFLMIQSGQLTQDTYVWTQGMEQWAMAKDTGLSRLFTSDNAVPPPFPPVPPIK